MYIDLHSHILPAIDDGSTGLDMSVEMARMAVADGIQILACTPHFMPGVYDTKVSNLSGSIEVLSQKLSELKIPLKLIAGGDVHVDPALPAKLAEGMVPTLAETRYFLLEPPHHVAPPNLDKLCTRLVKDGYVPVITHPERLTWIENHYDLICQLDEMGMPIQLTAKSVTGEFGKRPKYWSDRMLEEGRVDIIASDAHNTRSRPPGLSRAHQEIERLIGKEKADVIALENPALILRNQPLVMKLPRKKRQKSGGFWSVLRKNR